MTIDGFGDHDAPVCSDPLARALAVPSDGRCIVGAATGHRCPRDRAPGFLTCDSCMLAYGVGLEDRGRNQ